MNPSAYEPSYNAATPAAYTPALDRNASPDAPLQGNHYIPEPPAPPRMRMVPGDGGLGVMFAALAKAQLNFKPVKADAHVEIQPNAGKSYKFAYAPLENVLAACVPALNAEGFFFSQPLYSAADGEGYVLRTCLMHASGGLIEVETHIPKPAGRIQDLGSAITYQRRYVAQALFGVNSEDDDDGAGASGDKRTVQPPRAPQPSAAPAARPAQNGSPAAAPKAPPASSATAAPSVAASAPPAAATPSADPAPANETTTARELTEEQSKDIGALFGKLVPRVSRPQATKITVEVTEKSPEALNYDDGEKLKAYLQERIAKQGAAS